ncbi:MAG: hypothetical protein NTV04_10160 [Deltaproteobacteria bacterium]|nr:hypothetical protein [Deltaproteobacteria bacterium]
MIKAMAMRQNTIQYNPDDRETLTITEVPCLKDEINRLVYDLYGLTHGEIALVEKKFEISNLKSEIPKGEKSEIPKGDPKGKPEGL